MLVVGGGLAGLTAAGEAAKLGLRCLALTGPVPGGLLLSIASIQGLPEHVEGIPGYDLCPIAQEAAMDAGAEFVGEDASALVRDGDSWLVSGDVVQWRARSVVLAPGSRLRALNLPGEERLKGRGVSHCANCDGPMLRGRPVAVVGGGDAACQEALELATHASVVHMLVRGSALRASDYWQQGLRAEPKIQVHLNTSVTAVEGDQAVQALQLDNGSSLLVDAVFIYAGLLPNTEWLSGGITLDAAGRICADIQLRCSLPGLFAAGSARSGHSGQAVDAISDGLAAARAAKGFLDQPR